jgi:hypothetical protein
MKTFKQIIREFSPSELKYHLHRFDDKNNMSHISSSNDLESLKEMARNMGTQSPKYDYNISNSQEPSSASEIHGYNAKIDDFVKYTKDDDSPDGWKSHWPIVDRIKEMDSPRKNDYLRAWNSISSGNKPETVSKNNKIPLPDVHHIDQALKDKGNDYWPFHKK